MVVVKQKGGVFVLNRRFVKNEREREKGKRHEFEKIFYMYDVREGVYVD